MENSKRRVGRPKSEPRTGPLVLGDDQGREKIEVELTAATARDLAEYAAWVELSSNLTTADAVSKTVDYAVRDVLRRDRVWKERQRTPTRTQSAPIPTSTQERRTSAPPPSLPPSPPRDSRA